MCEGEPFAGAPIAFNQGSGCKIRKKFALPRVRQIKKRPKASFLFGGAGVLKDEHPSEAPVSPSNAVSISSSGILSMLNGFLLALMMRVK